MLSEGDFEAARAETDPVLQAQRATELITEYQQRSTELARLRRDAINRAVRESGLSYTEIADRVGLSKGRVSQIRSSAPPTERALFGIGPLTLAVPLRSGAGRPEGFVSRYDSEAADRMDKLLTSLSFVVDRYLIPEDGQWVPPADAVTICGPKSSHVTTDAIASDPWLDFSPDDEGRWVLRDREGDVLVSPFDQGDQTRDLAYVARLPLNNHSIFVIAGVHALGSVGAVDHISRHARQIYDLVGGSHFSMVVSSTFDAQGNPTETEALWGPKTH